MTTLIQAIKERWTANSLGSSVTGGIWHSRVKERPKMPYCVFTEVSSSVQGETRCSRITRAEYQFDIYADDGDPGTSRALAKTVRDAFVNSDDATSNPLNPTEVGVSDVRLTRDIITQADGDEQVYRSTFGLVIVFTESPNRTPA